MCALGRHVAAVGGERQLKERAGKARPSIDHGKKAARGDVETLQGAAQQADRLVHEPMIAIGDHGPVTGQHGVELARGLEQQRPDLGMAGA